MPAVLARNGTKDTLDVFLVGPDLFENPCFGLKPGLTAIIQCAPYAEFALGAFSEATASLIYLEKAKPDGTVYLITPNVFGPAAQAAQYGVSVRDDVSISIPINNGTGSLTSSPYTTFGATINGSFQITAPPEGTWEITVMDTVKNQQIYYNPSAVTGQTYLFDPYQTGFTLIVQVTAKWSILGNTNLEINLVINA